MKYQFSTYAIPLAAVASILGYRFASRAKTYYRKGKRYFDKGAFIKAIPLYEASVRLDPFRLESLKDLAHSYHWIGDSHKAVDIFEKALSLSPDDSSLRKSLAQAYSWSGNYNKASKLYRIVIDETGDVDARHSLAEVLLWSRQYEEAKGLLEVLMEENPSDKKTKRLLAKALHFCGDAKAVINLYYKKNGPVAGKERSK